MAHSKGFGSSHSTMSHRRHRISFGTQAVSSKAKNACSAWANEKKRKPVQEVFESISDCFGRNRGRS